MQQYLRIFLIDDDTDDLELLQGEIEAANNKILIHCFTDATSAVSHLHKSISEDLPNLIVVDNNMPKMTGLEFIMSIRAAKNLERLPIMMYSTDISMITAELKEKLYFNANTKSVSMAQLRKDVADMIAYSQWAKGQIIY